MDCDSCGAGAEIGLDSGNILKATSTRCHRISATWECCRETTPGTGREAGLMWAKPRDSEERVLRRSWDPRNLAGVLAMTLAST